MLPDAREGKGPVNLEVSSSRANPGLRTAIDSLSKTYRRRLRQRKCDDPGKSGISEITKRFSDFVSEVRPCSPDGEGLLDGSPDLLDSKRVSETPNLPAPQWRTSQDDSGTPNDGTTLYVRLRRAARAVLLIQRVCRICKDLVYQAVSHEDWYPRGETLTSGSAFGQRQLGVRPFITLVPNEKKELVQLTFDRSEYCKERRVDLTNDIRILLRQKPETRTPDQVNEVVRFLKRASPDFNSYPLNTQRRMVHCMWFDTYLKDRVITKEATQADAIFFVLSGKLVEKAKGRQQLREIKQGERFGEEDLKCACPRRTTVLTRSTVDLITIHRLDYRAIFNMSDDSNDPSYLDICKRDLVFQHFPIDQLIGNPGVWTVLSYKFGCLMVKDSNEMEWIYIIKSGEARVIKHLAAGSVDLRSRRQIIDARNDSHNSYHKARQIINFVSEKEQGPSIYRPATYRPRSESSRSLLSAPASLSSAQQRCRRLGLYSGPNHRPVLPSDSLTSPTQPELRRQSASLTASRSQRRHMESRPHVDSRCIARYQFKSGDRHGNQPTNSPPNHTVVGVQIEEIGVSQTTPRDVRSDFMISNFSPRDVTGDATETHTRASGFTDCKNPRKGGFLRTATQFLSQNISNADFLKLPTVGATSTPRSVLDSKNPKSALVRVPPYVQLEALSPGRVFGLRSCLEPGERGPSASLVSGGCQVLQINKKFFMKHADEALLGLIKLKYKAFPSEEELVDRLDVNIRWEEFKQSTVIEFLKVHGKDVKSYSTAFMSVC